MTGSSMKEGMMRAGLKSALQYLDGNPDENIPKLLDWIGRFDTRGQIRDQITVVRSAVEDRDNNWYRLIRSLRTDIDDGVRKTIFENFIINEAIIGQQRQRKAKAENDCNIPFAILLDPTSACRGPPEPLLARARPWARFSISIPAGSPWSARGTPQALPAAG